MTTEQKEILKAFASVRPTQELIDFVEKLEKQAAIDALAKAERIQEKQELLPCVTTPDYDWFISIGGRCGMFSAYLDRVSQHFHPDELELIAMEFDKNIFSTDAAMAKRFRDAIKNKQ